MLRSVEIAHNIVNKNAKEKKKNKYKKTEIMSKIRLQQRL